jgi:xylulokinase
LTGVSQIRVTGGGAKSELWRQILADVLGVEIVTVNSREGAAYGAGLIAATGAGAFSDLEEACKSVVHITGETAPTEAQDVYNDLYPIYRNLYPALKPSFEALSSFDH